MKLAFDHNIIREILENDEELLLEVKEKILTTAAQQDIKTSTTEIISRMLIEDVVRDVLHSMIEQKEKCETKMNVIELMPFFDKASFFELQNTTFSTESIIKMMVGSMQDRSPEIVRLYSSKSKSFSDISNEIERQMRSRDFIKLVSICGERTATVMTLHFDLRDTDKKLRRRECENHDDKSYIDVICAAPKCSFYYGGNGITYSHKESPMMFYLEEIKTTTEPVTKEKQCPTKNQR